MRNTFIGRQAIYDRSMGVYAYEILYREGKTPSAPQLDGDQASARLILNILTEIGLDRIVGPHQAFINLTRNFFVEFPDIQLDPEKVVLEVLEDVVVDDHMIESVARLSDQGYRIALDDFEFEEKWDSLIPHVDFIKVEVPTLKWEGLEQRLDLLRHHNVRLLAEKVETEEEYLRLYHLGFDYFQGYFFSRPNVILGRRMSENHLVILKLLARINDPRATINELEELISQDPGISYKMLRYLNSAAISLPRKIDSIAQAVIYLGLRKIRAWASLIALSGLKNKPQELFNTALVRAHMCQALVHGEHNDEHDIAFTVGLFSILDSLLDQPLAEILTDLPLSEKTQNALLKYQGPVGRALKCTLACENREWDEINAPGLNWEEILNIYLNSFQLAFQEQNALLI